MLCQVAWYVEDRGRFRGKYRLNSQGPRYAKQAKSNKQAGSFAYPPDNISLQTLDPLQNITVSYVADNFCFMTSYYISKLIIYAMLKEDITKHFEMSYNL
jgi:hypothetical protein